MHDSLGASVHLSLPHTHTYMYTHTHAETHIHGNERGQYKCDLQMNSYVKWLNTYFYHHHTGSPQSRHYCLCQLLNAHSQTHTRPNALSTYRRDTGTSAAVTARKRRVQPCTDMRADVGLNRGRLLSCLWQSVMGAMVKWRIPLGGSVSGWLRSVERPIFAASQRRCKCGCESTSQIMSVLLILWHCVCIFHTWKKSSTW